MKEIKEVETESENSKDNIANYYFVYFSVYLGEITHHTSRGVCIVSSRTLDKIPVGSITQFLCKKYTKMIGVEFVTPIEKDEYEKIDRIYIEYLSELSEIRKLKL